MQKDMSVKKIFVGSPSDTSKERKCVDEVVKELNQSIGDLLRIKFETIKWETHSSPRMGRPQEVINEQLKIENCDIFLGIIWAKFGSPSGGKNDAGIAFESGTEEEFSIAYNLWKTKKSPDLMIFRSIKKTSTKNVDVEQLKKVNEFMKEFSYNKSHPGLYKEYNTVQEFEKMIRMSLIHYAISNTMGISTKSDTSGLIALSQYGIENLYVPELNSERNVSKVKSLYEDSDIYLIAHSCYSFIAQFGHRFRDIIEEKLQKGYTFKAIASNPWSESSFFASYGEMYDNLENYHIIGDDGKKYLDCIRIIEQSKCYSVKYKDSINGYLMLRQKYGDKIQLRFTKYEMMSSILLTDQDCYFEPYLPVNLDERYEKGMLTFELKVSKTSNLYRHNRKYFDFLWGLSEDYDSYITHIEEYKERLKSKTMMEVD